MLGRQSEKRQALRNRACKAENPKGGRSMRFSRRKSITILAVTVVSLVTALMASRAAQKARPQVNLETLFSPSGWMGDGEYGRKYIGFGTDTAGPHSPPDSIKI